MSNDTGEAIEVDGGELGLTEEELAVEEPAPAWAPLYDKILVKRDKPKEYLDSEGRLKIADVHQKTQNRGRVVAVGEGRLAADGHLIPLKVGVGMAVLFGQYAGTDMEENPNYVMLREDELLGYQPLVEAE